MPLLLCPPVVFVALGSWEGEKVAALDTVGLDKRDHCGEVEGDRVSTDTADEGVEVEVEASVMACDGRAVKLIEVLRAGLGE